MTKKVDIYRPDIVGSTKIVSVCMNNEGNKWTSKHIKRTEINELDYLICEGKRYEIKYIKFDGECMIVTNG